MDLVGWLHGELVDWAYRFAENYHDLTRAVEADRTAYQLRFLFDSPEE
jgi:hypothetical protein